MGTPARNYSIAELIDKYYEGNAEPPRPHMGCSQLGHPCDRWLWLSFRWAVQPDFSGRVLRMFRRGQQEEQNIVRDLRAIGMDVRCTGNRQLGVDFGAHVSGSADAIIESGVPEAHKRRHVAEFKTHNKKSFESIEKDGVEKSNPMHYVQMQLYMHGLKIDCALYVAVCKDDDRIYTERIQYDQSVAEKYVERGRRLALEARMPPPISTDPSWYQCKLCPAHEFCHKTQLTQHVNCRTCAHSTPKEDSTWRCERHDADGIPVEFQRSGCDSHVLHPDLVPWPLKESPDRWTAIYVIDGRDVVNGEGDAHIYTSREIISNPQMCSLGDEYVEQLRAEFGARVVR